MASLRTPARALATLLALLIVGSAVLGATGGLGRLAGPLRPDAARAADPVRRVAVLVLENRDYGDVVGNLRAPFLNALARRYALATRYRAVGHPSLPNYIALTGGSTYTIHSDCSGCEVGSAPNLVTQLDRRGVSWKAYFQSIPRVGFLGGATLGLHSGRVRYTRAYDPFVYFDSVTSRPSDRARLVGFSQLRADLRHGTLPRFSWLAPDLSHDGHNGSIGHTDRYLAGLVPQVLRELGRRGLLFITWDEGRRHPGQRDGGHVPLIIAGGDARRHMRLGRPADHYALLGTVERLFGLHPLGRAGSADTSALTAGIAARAVSS